MMQISEYAKNRELQVLGLYHANEAIDDRQLGSGPRTIADKLQQKCSPHAVALLVRTIESLRHGRRPERCSVFRASPTKALLHRVACRYPPTIFSRRPCCLASCKSMLLPLP